jgi:hypothetical protein
MDRPVLSWDAYEYHHIDRTSDWFWSLGIIAISVAILAILFGNILFGIFIILGAIAAGMYAARPPYLTRIELNHDGVKIDDLLYKYRNINSFYIDEFHHHHPRIVFTLKKLFTPHIIILIDHQSSDDIRDYLLDYIPEIHHEDSVIHTLFEKLGL